MTELDPKDSVRKEQAENNGDTKMNNETGHEAQSKMDINNENTGEEKDPVDQSPSNQKQDEEVSSVKEDNNSNNEIPVDKNPELDRPDNTQGEELNAVNTDHEDTTSPVTSNNNVVTEEKETKKKEVKEEPAIKTSETKVKEPDEKAEIENSDSPKPPPKSDTIEKEKKDIQPKVDTPDEKQEEQKTLPSLKEIDYSKYSKEQLVDTLRNYISEYSVEKIKNHVETIKSVFYKIHNEEITEIYDKFIESGGKEEDFKVEESPVELNMKELLNIFREKRNELSKNLEEQKETNLKTKYEIIEAIKELINSQESLNKTFHDFRNLQEHWREVGPVPQKNVKDLWESYHYHVEAFYDYIKINKELRDLDFKKNLDAKLQLCEKAEELLLETSVVEAFRKLQSLHDQWREIGPVPADKRTELWERFRDATSKINRRHQEYFVNLKEEQKKNLAEKTVLCEKAEEIASQEIDDSKNWEEKSRELIELQKVWKTIGFAPKKHNTKIYERFRAACDKFFDKKREYFAANREEQDNNLQLKTELCIQAEAMQDSTDWKKTTDELIKLQKRWKAIGPVPIKNSEKIWKRFRAACDTFFNNKSEYFANIDSKYEDNLKSKEYLIKKIKEFEPGSDVEENLTQLKNFQKEWAEIGFVPIKMKNEIQEHYREAINKKFDQLKLDENRKSILKFRSRIENIASKPNAERRLLMERDKCYNKIKQLENDITLWENNIGFFSESKNAESMITDVEMKIKSAKQKMETLQEKLNILDEYDF